MAPALNPARSPARATALRVALLLVVAIAARAQVFGNPVVHVDEQFYLSVAGRMLHDGVVPYVDIFDRKPIGLFLLYTLAWLPGGHEVLAYQAMALAAAWGTAWAVMAMGTRVASPAAGTIAGLLYIVCLNLAGGQGGQSPVFYNLPVALAAATVLSATLRDDGAARLRRSGLIAMALTGVAMQIKYTAVFEGLFFGLTLLGTAWRRGAGGRRLVLDAALWVGMALLPTALAMLAYAAMGHFHDWWFANVLSVLARDPEAPRAVARRVRVMAALLVPLVATIPLRRWLGATPADPPRKAAIRFVDGWAAAALLGLIAFGTWFDHYALPLFVPLAVAAAPLARRRLGRDYLVLLLGVATVIGQTQVRNHRVKDGNARVLAAAAHATMPFRGCIFVFEGWPALYDAAHSCWPTVHAFPSHLHSTNERHATGVDQIAEIRRIMAGSPERVLTMEPIATADNPDSRAALYAVLRRRYHEIWRFQPKRGRAYVLYGLDGRPDPVVAACTGTSRCPQRGP